MDEFRASVQVALKELDPKMRELLPFPVYHFSLKESLSPNRPHVVDVYIDVLAERFAEQGWMNSLPLSLIDYRRTPILLWKQNLKRELAAKVKELATAMQSPTA